jgi:hypothetical protein
MDIEIDQIINSNENEESQQFGSEMKAKKAKTKRDSL